MLRVLDKLGYIPVPVVRAQQMGLCPAPHSPIESRRVDGHHRYDKKQGPPEAGPDTQGVIESMESKPDTTTGRSTDEVALELMKFVASTTGYGKGPQQVGFGGKGSRTPEEYAESLLQLFQRCREVVKAS